MAGFSGRNSYAQSRHRGHYLQFSLMPLVGYLLVNLAELPAEIAAGVLLVGCSPSRAGLQCDGLSGQSQPGLIRNPDSRCDLACTADDSFADETAGRRAH